MVTDIIEVPKELIQNNQEITLCVDIVYVQGLPFLATISVDIHFRTIQYMTNTKDDTIMEALDNVFRVYNKGNFKIKEIRADPEFIKISDDVLDDMDIHFNPTPAQAHEPFIERSNRALKERVRAMISRLPYIKIPKWMVISGVEQQVKWLNSFLVKSGVSSILSPRTIVTGKPINYNKQCTTHMGAYVLAHTENTPANTMQPQALSCIYLALMK